MAEMGKPQVFISYGREDLDRVRRLKDLLICNDLGAWLDVDEILPGEKWRSRVKQALASSEVVLVCLSNRSVSRRGFRLREIRWALDAVQELLDSDIYLIPVRLEHCQVPPDLAEYQYVDAFSDQSLERLIRAIREAILRRSRVPKDRAGLPATVPVESSDMSIDLSELGGGGILERFIRRRKSKPSGNNSG